MATWPSGSKASTDNVDAGTDKPSLARADIYQNIQNVNSIIDSFNISTHTDGYILVWDSANGRFNVAAPTTGGVSNINPGVNIDVYEESTGGVTISLESVVDAIELKDYKETIYTGGSTTGTITPDVVNGNVQTITLSGNITFNAFSNAEAGQTMTLIIKQPGSGGPYTLTSTMVFAGGTKTLSTSANAIDVMSVLYDGTTYYASLSTNFS